MVNEQGEFSTNPFGLKERAEQVVNKATARQRELSSSSFRRNSLASSISVSISEGLHYAEYHRRSESETHLEYPLVVLVGVAFDENLIEISDERRPKAHYLFFPKLGAEGQSALFITYIPSSVHGSVLGKLSDQLGIWFHSNRELEERLSNVINAGGLKSLQPDVRVYPKRVYRDRSLGNDAALDYENDGSSSSRSIVEVGSMYRGPVGLREREVTSASTRTRKRPRLEAR